LIKKSTYKQFYIVVLLAIYAFITTPPQLWHGHFHVTVDADFPLQVKNDKASSQISNPSDDGSCDICDHHYSVYIDDAISIIQQPTPDHLLAETALLCYLPSSRTSLFGNKGPPAAFRILSL
jgi:hypothetical protein